ncbi:DUF4097 family beta strand repeat-containing protein [Microterricola viridarii]|uniref:DUF4097 domain-containing protein n=1 Tax=Microterricola viridarii TaxID=412690 RepID=A0A109QXU1_9MICO|nr:DUF4097 family beta strand repeat-containing protein [Microterricola viridarii]AMB60199.1 hypothetical protein AWU67_16540 [Microterricola viridarii]
MRTTFRTVTAVAGIAIAALALSGCALLPAHATNDKATLTETVSAVRINGNSGSVTVQGVVGATDIRIEREIHYWGNKRQFDATYEVSGTELVLNGCGNRCSVDYTVELPEGVDVSGRTDNGAIELEAVNDVDVQTSNGKISLDEVAGRVKASTSNGRIEGEALNGAGIIAKTSNGSIELELETPQNVRANTSNGSITLHVPSGSFNVKAETSNGAKNINIPTDPNGTFLLDVGTSNGSITVSPVD